MTITTKPGRRFLSKYEFPTYIPKGASGGTITPGATKAQAWADRNWVAKKGFAWKVVESRKGQFVLEQVAVA